MWPDRVSNPGPLTYESGALPTALRGLARILSMRMELHEQIVQAEIRLLIRAV